jgi:anaerobic glycerol-3-phosphate dehydrogenase C subunit
MCPVYKGKRTETATPKAKANALRAVISGKIDRKQALQLPVMKELIYNCTGCQSCLLECPSNVNIPKIALEFKAEIVNKYGQSKVEYILGSFGLVAKLLRPISMITNWLMSTRLSRWLGEKTVGITRYRSLPKFSRNSFARWFRKNYIFTGINPTRKVAFFSGCSANSVNPNIGISLVDILQQNNIEVVVPKQKCCGLPMYTYGNIERGKKYAEYSIKQFLPFVRKGYDILVTCSSCGLSLKQEWIDLLGTQEAQEIADVTYHFSEYLLLLKDQGLLNENFGEIDLSVGYHTPCHLKVQSKAKTASTEVLQLIPSLRVNEINEGCCGICGSWGYKKENYEVSMKIGNGLLNELGKEKFDIGLTDCPTCKLQMEHGTSKDTQHPVELLAESYRVLDGS